MALSLSALINRWRFLPALLVLAFGEVAASEPCAPFRDGRVDAQILERMREAAVDGRLYRADRSVSRVGFCVKHFPLQEFRGEFDNIVGGLALPADVTQQGRALLLIHTSSLDGENDDLLPVVRGRHFMDTSRYPDILFVGRDVRLHDNGLGRVYGELTLHGVTQPVFFDIALHWLAGPDGQKDARLRLEGSGQVDRFSFDMKSYRYFVSESVRLCLSVELLPWEDEGRLLVE